MTADRREWTDSGQWRQRLGELCWDCAEAASDDQAALLRDAYALLVGAPRGEALRVGCMPGRSGFEALVSAGAFESAALALVNPVAGYLLSRGGNGVHLASVLLPDQSEEVASEARTAALALLSALAGALAAAGREPRPGHDGSADGRHEAVWLN